MERVLLRWTSAWRGALSSSIAVALAWILAKHLLHHDQPVFSAISAVVSLAPGLPSHGKQAVGLMLGVATGILVGEATLLLPDYYPLLRISFATFSATSIAALYGLAPIVPIQSGASAVLMLAIGPESAGISRMLDVIVGAGIGLLFSQVLLTPSPTRIIESRLKDFFKEISIGVDNIKLSLKKREKISSSLLGTNLISLHASLVLLEKDIRAAKNSFQWTLRGFFFSRQIKDIINCHEKKTIQLYASLLLLSKVIFYSLTKDSNHIPPELYEKLTKLHIQITALSKNRSADKEQVRFLENIEVTEQERTYSLPLHWKLCIDCIDTLEKDLQFFKEFSTVKISRFNYKECYLNIKCSVISLFKLVKKLVFDLLE